MVSIDKDTILQILGCLLKNPYILSQTDKYVLNADDFHDKLDKYLFSTIYNLYMGGIEKIGIVDIENYMKDFAGPKAIYDKYNGAEYLQDAIELSKEDNFHYYYNRFKKLSLLRQLQKDGYNIDKIYCENPFAENAAEINENFEELTTLEILNSFKKDLAKLENNFTAGTGTEAKTASSGLRDLLVKLKETPDIGCALQGKIFNTVTRGARKGKYYLRSGSSGFGKALLNSTSIPTPNGWKTVGEIKKGDYLFDAFGKPTKVLEIFPQGMLDVWEIEFKDGRKTFCSGDHLWSYHTSGQKGKAIENRHFFTSTTEELSKKELKTKEQYKILVPMQKAVEYSKKELFIDPYVFGLLLGDGSFRQQSTNKVLQFSSETEELPKKISETMGWKLKRGSINNFTWYFSNKEDTKNIHVEEVFLNYPELINLYSEEKFIPEIFLQGSIEQRLDLLNGLLDSDGSVDEKGRVSYSTVSEKLKNGIIELAQSLGFKTSFLIDKRKDRRDSYLIHISGKPELKNRLFKLKRKREKMENWFNNGKRKEKNELNAIINIQKLNYKEEMTCFLVDNEEHLFLTEDFIVTHNTRAALGDACYLSYPVRFNTKRWEWEVIGSAEKTLFIATEQEAEDIQTMILSYLTGFNEEKLLEGTWNKEEEKIYNEAILVTEFFSNNLIIKRIPEPNIENVRAAIRNEFLTRDIDNVFYDYIFSTPSLLGEFRDLRLREDVVLRMLSTALKDLAVEMNIFVMSSTQVNSAADGEGAKGVESISGSKAIIEKADFGCIASELGKEELELIEGQIFEEGLVPNQVIDVYKMRRGRLNRIRIWSHIDLGTCRTTDLFITNKKNQAVENFQIKNFLYAPPDIPKELKEILKLKEKR